MTYHGSDRCVCVYTSAIHTDTSCDTSRVTLYTPADSDRN